MWKKRSQFEISELRRKNAKRWAMFSSIFYPILSAVTYKIGYEKYSGTFNPISWAEVAKIIPLYLVGGLLIYFVVFEYLKNRPSNSTRFCIKCEKTFQKLEVNICDCGGKVDYLGDYTYVAGDNQ